MDNVHVVELSKYTAPKIIEHHSKDWVEYGEDNQYFQFIIDRYNGSTTNRTVIDSICNWIYGKGLGALDSNQNLEGYASMLSLLKKKDLKNFIKDRYLLGMGALQVVKNKGKITSVTHFPMNTLRAGKMNEDGEIDTWFYHPNWEDTRKVRPIPYSDFYHSSDTGNSFYIAKPYIAGCEYYAPPVYSLEYPLMEEEIADYLINEVQNSFSGTKIINFNNGILKDERQRQEAAARITKKVTGSQGKKVIVNFNKDKENATTVEDISLNDAPSHYEYLSTEARDKILLGHKVTSPLLLGIREAGGGLGSNSDEIKNATLLFDNIVIKPLQIEILDCLEVILSVNEISLDLYFKTIEPLEFIDTDGMDEETKEEETGKEQLSIQLSDLDDLDTLEDDIFSLGEDFNENDEEWDILDVSEAGGLEDENEYLKEIEKLENDDTLLSKIWKFATGTARPNSKSSQDAEKKERLLKVRYIYHPLRVSENSRKFCKDMVKAKKMYRKEDIEQMSAKGLNKSFGHKGQAYDLFKYKGGPRCNHRWRRVTFVSKEGAKGIDTKSPLAKKIGTREAEVKYGYKVKNPWEVSVRPVDMPRKGFHPNNKNLPKDAR